MMLLNRLVTMVNEILIIERKDHYPSSHVLLPSVTNSFTHKEYDGNHELSFLPYSLPNPNLDKNYIHISYLVTGSFARPFRA